jgi:peptide deformylase
MTQANIKLYIYPYPTLRQKSLPFERDSLIPELFEKLCQLMYDNNGIGLAANQVGLLERFFVMDTSENRNNPVFFINPIIKSKSSEIQKIQEGCLSIPGFFSDISRPKTIQVEYTNQDGKRLTHEFSGLDSTCIQHEIDHLDGILFPDRITSASKQKRFWQDFLSHLNKK